MFKKRKYAISYDTNPYKNQNISYEIQLLNKLNKIEKQNKDILNKLKKIEKNQYLNESNLNESNLNESNLNESNLNESNLNESNLNELNKSIQNINLQNKTKYKCSYIT